MTPPPPRSTLFPYTTLFRSHRWRADEIEAYSHDFARDRARPHSHGDWHRRRKNPSAPCDRRHRRLVAFDVAHARSEEHTSELQSHSDLVCRLLLEKKKKEQP